MEQSTPAIRWPFKILLWIIIAMTALAAGAVLIDWINTEPQHKPVQSQAATDPEIKLPDHWYAVKDGQHYAYEATGNNELIRIRYIGERDTIHKVVFGGTRSSNRAEVAECEPGCDYIKIIEYYGDKVESERLMKMEQGSVFWGIFQDAWNGKLDRYKNDNGEYLLVTRDGPEWSK